MTTAEVDTVVAGLSHTTVSTVVCNVTRICFCCTSPLIHVLHYVILSRAIYLIKFSLFVESHMYSIDIQHANI